MKLFLEKNEELRRRIAFYVDFPDYNAEELCDILKLMSKEKGYMLDEEADFVQLVNSIRQQVYMKVLLLIFPKKQKANS